MKKIDSFEIEPSEETWAMRRQGRGLVASTRKTACRCGRCRLYRWYPPLLVVSTIMTAVFCFLYLTKPVFLEAPVMKVNDGGKKVPSGYMVASTKGLDQGAREDASSTGSSKALDPGALQFPAAPGEADPVVAALSQPEPIDLLDVPPLTESVEKEPVAAPPVIEPLVLEQPRPMPVRVSVGDRHESAGPTLPGGFQPLRVQKADRPLFQSLTKADLARLEARRRANEAPALASGEGAAESDSPAGDDAPPAVAVVMDKEADDPEAETAEIDPVVAALAMEAVDEARPELGDPTGEIEEAADEAGEEPVMKASFIGEFYWDEEEEDRADEILNETVMR